MNARRPLFALGVGLLLGSVVTFAVGCQPATGPTATLDAYGQALRKRDYGKAYDMLSATYRAQVSKDAFIKMMNESPKEADETAMRLRETPASVDVSAEVSYGLGDTLRLVQEGGAWRIVGEGLTYYDQSSPKNCLRSFLRAYKLERWDIMLRFVPTVYASKMDAAKVKAQFTGPSKDKMDELVMKVAAAATEEIVENGASALLSYSDNGAVRFVREDGVWKIQDLD